MPKKPPKKGPPKKGETKKEPAKRTPAKRTPAKPAKAQAKAKPKKRPAASRRQVVKVRPGQSSLSLELSEELQALLEQETRLAQNVPLRDGATVTYRDEANVIVHQVLRAGFLEELHAGEFSPLLSDPTLSRITQAEMKRLMIETTAELAHWLFARDMDLVENPEHYVDKIQMLRNIFTQDWERHEITWSAPQADAVSRRGGMACGSCQTPLRDGWRFCPQCGKRAPGSK
ncbi:MAG TPA: zinc ribbon domain-containing protein [Isosphaeraceae bacterium]|nr:zinc ribbon domain-containing protein [Isosphaeraceae bacterium]